MVLVLISNLEHSISIVLDCSEMVRVWMFHETMDVHGHIDRIHSHRVMMGLRSLLWMMVKVTLMPKEIYYVYQKRMLKIVQMFLVNGSILR